MILFPRSIPHFFTVIFFVAAPFAVSEPPPQGGQFDFADGILKITTDRYEVTWQNGCMTGVKTRFHGGQDLTLPRPVMPYTVLPNGPGSFALNEQAGRDQHRPYWSHPKNKGEPEFPAHATPGKESVVECEEIPHGVRLTYSNLTGDPTAFLVQELTVDAENGDLVIRQSARSDKPGLFGIGFSLLNLRPDLEFALPYFSGIRIGSKYEKRVRGWAWPGAWSAGLIIGEAPDAGSFFVFADDPELRPKYFKLYAGDTVQGLGFEACTEAPYETQKRIEVFAWRFNTFEGGWLNPAKRYKQWLADTHGVRPARERPPEWFGDVALYCTLPSIDFEELARKIDPKHVLIGDYGWSHGFNRNAPFYRPKDEVAKANHIRKLREMGYHYAVYTAHKLVDINPEPEVRKRYWKNDNLLQKYGVVVTRDELSKRGEQLNENWVDEDAQLVERAAEKDGRVGRGIHPGSDAWIEFYSDLMVDFHRQYGMNTFYQDISGSHYGSSGLLDGRNLHQGTVACEKRIREKLPESAGIGEHWNEVNVAMHMQLGSGNYSAWFSPTHYAMLGGERAHPIKGYIFGDYTGLVMYKTPQRNTENFHRDQNFLEITGSIPTLRTDVRPGKDIPEVRLTLLRAQLFADGFRPYFPDDTWEENAVAFLRDPKGRLVKYLRTGGSTICLREENGEEKLYYARITGTSSPTLPGPAHIDGWIAYNKNGPIGLSPKRWYCVFPGPPEETPVKISSLPQGVWLDEVRRGKDYLLVKLGGQGAGLLEYISTLTASNQTSPGQKQIKIQAPESILFPLTDSKASPIQPGELLPLNEWVVVEIVNGMVTREVEWHQKPRQMKLNEKSHFGHMVVPPSGGVGAETSIDGYIQIPDDSGAYLSFQMGRLGGSGDGVHFIVRVNGKEIWRKFSPAHERDWNEAIVPLEEYAGQNIVLSLAVDSGPKGMTSNDQSLWGDVKIVVPDKDISGTASTP